MSENRKLLIKSIALPLLVGAVVGLLTRNAMQDFDTRTKKDGRMLSSSNSLYGAV